MQTSDENILDLLENSIQFAYLEAKVDERLRFRLLTSSIDGNTVSSQHPIGDLGEGVHVEKPGGQTNSYVKEGSSGEKHNKSGMSSGSEVTVGQENCDQATDETHEGQVITVWVDEPEFDPHEHYKTGSHYEILLEKRLFEADELDPESIVWVGSLRKPKKLKLWERMKGIFDEGQRVQGEIIALNKGGFAVDVLGVRAFLPKSLAYLPDDADSEPSVEEVGKVESFHIVEFSEDRCNLIVSRREILQQLRDTAKERQWSEMIPGTRWQGTVQDVSHPFVRVDLGALQGTLHVSNVAWERVDNVEKCYQVGDEIEVIILDVNKKKERIELGVKQLTDNPWDSVKERYKVGGVYKGKITSLVDFGLFVELEPAVEGLVHVSELSWLSTPDDPRALYEVGQEVEVKLKKLDLKKKRISLSIKETKEKPWTSFAKRVSTGDLIEGVVVAIEPYGVFVEIEPGITGLIHTSDLSWTENYDLKKIITESKDSQPPKEELPFKLQEQIQVKVLSLDPEKERMGLGLKQLTKDPWTIIDAEAMVGKKIPVTITRLTHFGAFAQVLPEVEGLIHISELAKDRVEDPRKVVHPGQEVEALVLSVDLKEQRISLSLYRDALDEEEPTEYFDSKTSGTSLGDLLKEKLVGREILESKMDDKKGEQVAHHEQE